MANVVGGFRIMLLVMLFYGFAITLITYSIPDNTKTYVTDFSNTNTTNLQSVGDTVETSVNNQINIPVIELGALVFYTSNILIDLLLNFLYAIPQMIGHLVHGLQILFNLDSYLFAYLQSFASIVITIIYMLGILQLLTGVRSGRII